MELDAHYSMVKSCVPAVPLTFYLGVRLKKVEDIKFPFVVYSGHQVLYAYIRGKR